MLHVRRFLLAFGLFATVLAFGAGPVGSADGFFKGVDDLPLMPGLTQADSGALVFESPWGRIIEVYASGVVQRHQVLDFYADTLPQLGWLPDGDGKFHREGETLALDFPAAESGPFTVRVTLTPAAAPPR